MVASSRTMGMNTHLDRNGDPFALKLISCQKTQTSTTETTSWTTAIMFAALPTRRISQVASAAWPSITSTTLTAIVFRLLHRLGCMFSPKCTATRSGSWLHALQSLIRRAPARPQITGIASPGFTALLLLADARFATGAKRLRSLRRSPVPRPARKAIYRRSARPQSPSSRPAPIRTVITSSLHLLHRSLSSVVSPAGRCIRSPAGGESAEEQLFGGLERYLLAPFALPEDSSPPVSPGVGLGALSPINRTLESRSEMLMPESDSNNAGTCAAISAISPVILLTPAEWPLPVETTVILSTLASGCAMARTTSGSPVISLSTTAA